VDKERAVGVMVVGCKEGGDGGGVMRCSEETVYGVWSVDGSQWFKPDVYTRPGMT
jgi:hypothetical protein